MKMIRTALPFFIGVSFVFIMLAGCGKDGAIDKKDVIVYVNKEPILLTELKREIALRAKQDPTFKFTPDTESEQLEMLINKKLVIQAAIKKGLANQDNFVNTIRAFWEQTLIRGFIDSRNAEMKGRLSATEDEIKKYYGLISEKVTFKVLADKSKKYIDEAYDELLKNKESGIIPWQTIGPVGYDDISSDVLLEAFVMDAGQIKRIDNPPDYYLVLIASKDIKEPPPLETIRADIEKRIIDMKERRLFEDWLKDQRKHAKLKFIKR
jgi:hypothetical protein